MTKLNWQRNLAFVLIILLGFFYLGFLSVAFHKIFPGFVMQIIFLLDAIKNNPSQIIKLVFSFEFLVNLFAGIFLFGLIIKVFNSLISGFKKITNTTRFISSLSLVKQKNYYLFDYSKPIVFTSGFLNPRVYLSSKLISEISNKELKAILFHEYQHQKNLDPLKGFIVNFIKSLLPEFIGKNWLFSNYFSLVEITCDQYAENNLLSKKPIVSALLKLNNQFHLANFIVNQFSSQTERIKVLVGQKKLTLKSFFAFNSLLLAVFLLISSFTYKTDLFYECTHLVKCFQFLISENKENSANSSSLNLPVSNHCSTH